MLYIETGMGRCTETCTGMEMKLNLITKHAIENEKQKFTSLVHLLNEENLKECFHMLKRDKAAGIDKVTMEDYKQYLDFSIRKLVKRMKEGSYRPKPVKRIYIPKRNGQNRPLGIPALEDKIVQMGIKRILVAIYEPVFLECSHGFREGRGCHQALKVLENSINVNHVNYVLDADIKSFFENVEHQWLMKMLRERIIDRNFLSLVNKFLKAGVIEGKIEYDTVKGVPQGGVLSPVLSNIYLHYVLDLWLEKVVKKRMEGYIEEVRFADDVVILIQRKNEAEKMIKWMEIRLNKFGLTLSKEKTRLIEYGRFAEENARRRGNKPDSFDFLGFTHYCARNRKQKFKVGRKTKKKKLAESIKEIGIWLKSVRNIKIKYWWKTLIRKINGHYEYFSISGNSRSIENFYFKVRALIYKWLNRRSQKKSLTWDKFEIYLKRFPLPKPKIKHKFYANMASR